MAKTTTSTVRNHLSKPKKKRAGRHSKKKTSSNKNCKNYKKKYRGQGR
jgi:hypothetical protein